jgi:hypothetical protein
VSHAITTKRALALTTNPAILFRVTARFKARRIAQIRIAASKLFPRRPLQIRIGDFSQSTHQIYTIIPALGEMVVFSVVQYPCGAPETVEVGKEYPISTTRRGLLRRIRDYSTVTNVK